MQIATLVTQKEARQCSNAYVMLKTVMRTQNSKRLDMYKIYETKNYMTCQMQMITAGENDQRDVVCF